MTEATKTPAADASQVEPVTWLTQEAYDRLKAELEHLSGPARTEISARIGAARAEGDLKENGGYHAAKEEQGKLEARIRQLTVLLRDAKVGESPTTSGVAGPGMVVEVRFEGDDTPQRFLIGSREDNTHDHVEVYSAQSPLGLALTGAKIGDTVTYTLPNSKVMKVELLSAQPYVG